jgi:hypothetical protein
MGRVSFFLQLRVPVRGQCDRLGYRRLQGAIDQESLPIRRHVIDPVWRWHSTHPKQRLDLSNDWTPPLLRNPRRHQNIFLQGDKKECFAVAPPMRLIPAVRGNLPLAGATRKGGNINLSAARFLRAICNPFPIWRNSRERETRESLRPRQKGRGVLTRRHWQE